MMPNIIQYPIISLAVIRAGYILVNINPYTARELKHQLNDAGAKVLFILEQFYLFMMLSKNKCRLNKLLPLP